LHEGKPGWQSRKGGMLRLFASAGLQEIFFINGIGRQSSKDKYLLKWQRWIDPVMGKSL